MDTHCRPSLFQCSSVRTKRSKDEVPLADFRNSQRCRRIKRILGSMCWVCLQLRQDAFQAQKGSRKGISIVRGHAAILSDFDVVRHYWIRPRDPWHESRLLPPGRPLRSAWISQSFREGQAPIQFIHMSESDAETTFLNLQPTRLGFCTTGKPTKIASRPHAALHEDAPKHSHRSGARCKFWAKAILKPAPSCSCPAHSIKVLSLAFHEQRCLLDSSSSPPPCINVSL